MSDRKTFCVAGAVAVNVIDAHATVVMPIATAADEGNIEPAKLITLDLTRRLRNTDWDNVIIDTLGVHADGTDKAPAAQYAPEEGFDVLTVGPVFPGQTVGGIYFERDMFYQQVRPVFDPDATLWPDSDTHTYQYMTSATQSGGNIARYHGFHARVIKDFGTTKLLAIKNHSVTKKFKIDMNDRAQCDDPAPLRAEIQDPSHPDTIEYVLDATSVVDTEGAVFLPLAFCAQNELFSPKEPRGADGFLVRLPTAPSEAPPFNDHIVHVGDPDNDDFTRSVFTHSLSKATKIPVRSTELNRLRNQLIQIAARASKGTSLDIVADAPSHIQRIGPNTIGLIFDDAWSSLDDELVRRIRFHFSQCRLLGCFTAGDLDVRRGMMRLASVLRMPVVGTLRAIGVRDFTDTGFRDTQEINGVKVEITLSTAQMMPSGRHVNPEMEKLIRSGEIQRAWLAKFPTIKPKPDDLVFEPDNTVPVIPVSAGFFAEPLASTDEIQTEPIGVIALETADKLRFRAEVLAGGTLLRLAVKASAPIYVNIPHDGLDVARILKALR